MKLEPEVLEAIFTNKGNDLYRLSTDKCVLLVFLRHFGCTFCREALDDVSKIQNELSKRNIQAVFVHMAEDNVADEYFKDFKLDHAEHISDPDMSLYEYFGLHKGSFSQLYGLKIWMRGFELREFGVDHKDTALGNQKQMPGVFMLRKGQIHKSYIHESAADKPDYLSVADCDCN